MNTNCPTEDIGFLIWKISKFWQRAKHKTLDEFGLTGPQLEMLGAICHLTLDKVDVTQIILSQEIDVDPMTTSIILRNLQKKGLVNRKESLTDTRARNVELTEAGNELFLKAIEKVKLLQSEIFANIDQDALRIQLKLLLNELNSFNIKNNE